MSMIYCDSTGGGELLLLLEPWSLAAPPPKKGMGSANMELTVFLMHSQCSLACASVNCLYWSLARSMSVAPSPIVHLKHVDDDAGACACASFSGTAAAPLFSIRPEKLTPREEDDVAGCGCVALVLVAMGLRRRGYLYAGEVGLSRGERNKERYVIIIG